MLPAPASPRCCCLPSSLSLSAGGSWPRVPQLPAVHPARVSLGMSHLEIPAVASQGAQAGFSACLPNCSRGGQAPSSVPTAHARLYGVFPFPRPRLQVDPTHPAVLGGHGSHPRPPGAIASAGAQQRHLRHLPSPGDAAWISGVPRSGRAALCVSPAAGRVYPSPLPGLPHKTFSPGRFPGVTLPAPAQ